MLAEKYDVFLLDLDGVIYCGNQLLPGSKAAMDTLRSMNKKICFLTNDPRISRQELCEKLTCLGITASLTECVTSGWAAAWYLGRHRINCAYVVGTESLKTEISQHGIRVAACGEDCQAVVIGYSDAAVFYEIQQAVNYIQKGARFIATNPDLSFPGKQGRCVATGSIVQAVQAVSGQCPIFIGKPYATMFQLALAQYTTQARVVMIGDSPETDIMGARQCGLDSILVKGEQAVNTAYRGYPNPEATIGSLLDLFRPGNYSAGQEYAAFPWPDTLAPGVAGVVFNERDQILLVKRVDNGLWGLPSGHVERAETVTHAVCREIYEETGLTVSVEKLVGVYSDPVTQVFRYPSGKVTHFITLSFFCRIKEGVLQVDQKEISEAGFFNIDDLPLHLMTMHPRWLADALAERERAWIR